MLGKAKTVCCLCCMCRYFRLPLTGSLRIRLRMQCKFGENPIGLQRSQKTEKGRFGKQEIFLLPAVNCSSRNTQTAFKSLLEMHSSGHSLETCVLQKCPLEINSFVRFEKELKLQRL